LLTSFGCPYNWCEWRFPEVPSKREVSCVSDVGYVSSLCDALVGRRLWTDCDVVEERDTLLGEDEGASRAYVERV
jgi:hypothetical protein